MPELRIPPAHPESPALGHCEALAAELAEISTLATKGLTSTDLDGNDALEKISDWATRLTQDLRILQKYVGWTQQIVARHRPPFRHPGAKIMREVFFHTLPPNFLLDPTLSGGVNSPWCQILRVNQEGYSSVCRAWYDVGIEFLYRDVVIRRIGQVSALLETLQSQRATSAHDLASYMKSLTVICYVPKMYQKVFRRDMGEILKLARNLSRVHINVFGDNLTDVPLLDWDTYPVDAILCLEIGDHVTPLTTSPGLARCADGLRSFSLTERHVRDSSLSVKLEFSRLQIFECSAPANKLTSRSIQNLQTYRKMPSLDTLILRTTNLDPWVSFLEEYGPQLRRFAIPYLPHNPRTHLVEEIIDRDLLNHCTPLEHLVIAYCHPSNPRACSSTLKHLDFWVCDSITRDAIPDTEQAFWALKGVVDIWDQLPQLHSLRFFHMSIGAQFNVPFNIPPVSDVGHFDLHYAGIRLVCKSGNVFNKASDSWYEWVDMEYYSEEEEPSRLQLDAADTTTDDGSEGELSHDSESSVSQLDHDSALELFHTIASDDD